MLRHETGTVDHPRHTPGPSLASRPADAATNGCLPLRPRQNNRIARIGRPAEALGNLAFVFKLNSPIVSVKRGAAKISSDHGSFGS